VFGVNVPCCQPEMACVCGPEERVLRAYSSGVEGLPEMTAKQRKWCIEEADRAGEGGHPSSEAVSLSDKELAQWTLDAWSDYAQGRAQA
jgi:hypothetical protein